MQSWHGDALRCVRAQDWDALVLGFMELQDGDASQRSAEKGGESPSFGETNFFFHPSPFKSIFHPLLSPQKCWILQSIPFFRRKGAGGGVIFRDLLALLRA